MEELVSVEQLAEWLKVSRQTVYVWNHKRTGPKGIRVGKRVVYRRSDIEAWLRDQEV